MVPKMTDLEIYKEVLQDSASVLRTAHTKMHIQMYVMKRTHRTSWVETLHIKSPRHNNWSVVVNLSQSASDVNIYLRSEDELGMTVWGILNTDEMPVLIKYTAHFFKRYRERMELEETKPAQIIKRFFRNNVRITPGYNESEENGLPMAAISMPEGLGLGRLSSEAPITVMKTFIPHERLSSNKRELVKMLNEDEKFQEGLVFINSARSSPAKTSGAART